MTTTHRDAIPSSDRYFLDTCQKLLTGACSGQQYGAAWAALARWFDAAGVRVERANTAGGAPSPGQGMRLGRREQDPILVLQRQRPFTADERAWLHVLLTPVNAALELGRQLDSLPGEPPGGLLLSRIFPAPFILADESGRSVEAHRSLGGILDTVPGHNRDGRIFFDAPALHDAWQAALLDAHRSGEPRSIPVSTRTAERWTMDVVPFAFPGEPPQGLPRRLTFAMLRKANGHEADARAQEPDLLTRAERDVLANMLLGLGAKQIARLRDASVNTVRNQIASILAKTGHRSQKELMASMGTGAPADEFGFVGAIGANRATPRLHDSTTQKAAP